MFFAKALPERSDRFQSRFYRRAFTALSEHPPRGFATFPHGIFGALFRASRKNEIPTPAFSVRQRLPHVRRNALCAKALRLSAPLFSDIVPVSALWHATDSVFRVRNFCRTIPIADYALRAAAGKTFRISPCRPFSERLFFKKYPNVQSG